MSHRTTASDYTQYKKQYDIKAIREEIKVVWNLEDLQRSIDAIKASGWSQPKPKRIKIVTEFKKFTTCPECGHWEMIRKEIEE